MNRRTFLAAIGAAAVVGVPSAAVVEPQLRYYIVTRGPVTVTLPNGTQYISNHIHEKWPAGNGPPLMPSYRKG